MAGQFALVTASNHIRTFGPRDVEDQFHMHKKKDEIQAVLFKIEKIYGQLLPDGFLLEKGFCFGLVDPATNILINSIFPRSAAPTPPAGGGERAGDMNQRSLDGLIAFLTCLFPYLPDAEARVYLDAAEADPIVASLYIIERRGMREFDLYSETTEAAVEVALRCAAVAAKHPNPQGFVQGWKLLSSVLHTFDPVPSRMCRKVQYAIVLSAERVVKAIGASRDPRLQLRKMWDQAKGRITNTELLTHANLFARGKELPPARAAMKRMLLATIHGFYLQAMARLPADELHCKYHQSMLLGGYCYGPLDPASNIIVNTIWYEQNFPPSKQFQVAMISTKMLWRIVAQSLYGLISFLCTRYQGLTPDLAMQRLLVTGVNLQVADPKLSTNPSATTEMRLKFSLAQRSAVEESIPSATIPEAYSAAATAARHCYPLAHKEFLASLSGVEFHLKVLLHTPGSPDGGPGSADDGLCKSISQVLYVPGGGPLSSFDLGFLHSTLHRYTSTSESHQQQNLAPTKVKWAFYAHVSRCTKRFWGQHHRITTMVTDALEIFNRTAGDSWFNLHTICGVNEFVSGPVYSEGEKAGDYNPWTYAKYCHTHINFLAVCMTRPSDPPMLFFAECGKDGADTCWCVPVIPQKPEAEQARCIYCEFEGNRLVHPAVKSFSGRDEFEKFYESHTSYTNDRLIEGKQAVDWVHGVPDDAIYHECHPDSDDSSEEELSIC